MRGVTSLKRRLLVKRVRLVEHRSTIVLGASAIQGDVLGGEVVLRLGAWQRGMRLERPPQVLQASVAAMKSRDALLRQVDVVRLSGQSVHHRVYRLALAAQIFFAVPHQVRVLPDLVQPNVAGKTFARINAKPSLLRRQRSDYSSFHCSYIVPHFPKHSTQTHPFFIAIKTKTGIIKVYLH